MTATILTLLSTLVPFLVWLWKRRVQQKENPYAQHLEHRETLARELIQRDEAAANRSLDDDLDRLRTLQSDQQRAHDPSSPGR